MNNYIYRPVELEALSCYDFVGYYELKKMDKKIESGNHVIESKKSFNLMEEHPSYKYMMVVARKHHIIPAINTTKLLPNIAELAMHVIDVSNEVVQKREMFAKIVLSLFCSYRIQEDIKVDESYWEYYLHALGNKLISDNNLQVIQNLIDCLHNCTKLKTPNDELQRITDLIHHEDDKQVESQYDKENYISTAEALQKLEQDDDFGIRIAHPSKRKLSIISSRHNIVDQDITNLDDFSNNITEVPDFLSTQQRISQHNKTSNCDLSSS